MDENVASVRDPRRLREVLLRHKNREPSPWALTERGIEPSASVATPPSASLRVISMHILQADFSALPFVGLSSLPEQQTKNLGISFLSYKARLSLRPHSHK